MVLEKSHETRHHQHLRSHRRKSHYHGKQGLEYFSGVAAETAGSRGLCVHMVTIPPLGRAKPHLHANHESAVYVLSGESVPRIGSWEGQKREQTMLASMEL
jgi:uncharacterized RmlC-like cupin family protein